MTLIEIFLFKKHFATRPVGDELILVPVTSNVANMNELFTLNDVGSFIWHSIDGKRTEKDILNDLINEFSIDEQTARHDLSEFLIDLGALMNRP